MVPMALCSYLTLQHSAKEQCNFFTACVPALGGDRIKWTMPIFVLENKRMLWLARSCRRWTCLGHLHYLKSIAAKKTFRWRTGECGGSGNPVPVIREKIVFDSLTKKFKIFFGKAWTSTDRFDYAVFVVSYFYCVALFTSGVDDRMRLCSTCIAVSVLQDALQF
jgi:hypothetical protein